MITISNAHGIKRSEGKVSTTFASLAVGIDLKLMAKIDEMSNKEVKEYLKENNIEFKGNAKTEELKELAKQTAR